MKNFVILLLLATPFFSQAQNVSKYLDSAKELASTQKYEEALKKVDKGLSIFEESYELLTYKARLYLWSKNFASAEEVLTELMVLYPDDYLVHELILVKHWWSEQWKELLKATQDALRVFPDDPDFLLKQMLALKQLEDYEAALLLYEEHPLSLLEKYANEIRILHHQRVGYQYAYSRFSNTFQPWQVHTLRYQNVSKNAFVLSVSQARMFNTTGVGINGEYYFKPSERISGYVEIGASPSSIFPSYRLGAEGILNLERLQIIGGGKLLKFKNDERPTSIATAGLAKYMGNLYLEYKLYNAILNGSFSITHTAQGKYFFANRYHYLGLRTSRGAIPLQITNSEEIARINAYAIDLSYSQLLFNRMITAARVGFQTEEYSLGLDRVRLTGEISVAWIFDKF
ncbi:MAG: YaiO family outer membrane beta-barrel protein [Bacteroidota bacterium]